MSIRDNLVLNYARRDLALTVARHDLKNAGKPMTHAEQQLARLASATAMVRWCGDGCPEPGPAVTRADIDDATMRLAQALATDK